MTTGGASHVDRRAGGREKPTVDAVPRVKVEEVVVVFKTHFDIGYTDLARNVVDHYRTSMIDKALDVCDVAASMPAEQRFVWTLPGWPMAQILWSGQTPERRSRVLKAIREGRLVWHSLMGSTHTESLDLEEFVRGFRFSSELARAHGLPLPRDAKMTDVPSHSWIVPTMLKHAGVDFLHLGCNEASSSPDVPSLFWWEGPDGSRLLTMYTAGNYGTGLQAPEGWPHKTWLALIHTSDNHGPPCPADIEKLVEQAHRELPGVKLRFGRLSDFADAILSENPQLPVVRADMPDTWIYGIQSMPRETGVARHVRPEIGALESLNSLLTLWGVAVPTATTTIADAYEKSLMFGEHTWGYCMIDSVQWHYGDDWERAHAAGTHAVVEESWAEKGENIHNAARLVQPALNANMAELARSVAVDGPRIVVFNPLPWARDCALRTNTSERGNGLADATATIKSVRLRDVETNETVEAEVSKDSTLEFVARDVPSLGYRTYVPTGDAANASESVSCDDDATIENEYFRLRLDPARGRVPSLVEKQADRELVDANAAYGFGQYLYERFDAKAHRSYLTAYCKTQPWPDWAEQFGKPNLPAADEVAYAAASPGNFRLSVRRGPVSSRAELLARAGHGVPHDVRLCITLWQGCPFVDVELAVLGKKADPWPEAGWLCFPLKIGSPAFRLARLGSVIDPAKDICPGANHEMLCLSGGMTVSEPDGAGIGLCPIESPLISLGRPGLLRYTTHWTLRKPIVFVNLFNNVWGTNFQQWIDNVPASSVRIWATDHGLDESELVMRSWEARQPCFAAQGKDATGVLPPMQAGLTLSRAGVLVTAFGRNPDGNGILLRLWEQAGSDEPCCVRLPGSLHATMAQPCSLRGEAQGEVIPVSNGRCFLPLRRFAPTSVFFV